MPINGPAINGNTGEETNFRYVTFADAPDPLSGSPTQLMTVSSTRRYEQSTERTLVQEQVRYQGANGDVVELVIEHSPTVDLGHFEGEMAVRYPGSDVELRYWNDEAQQVIFDAAQNVDLRERFAYSIRTAATAEIFDGTQELTAIVAVPASRRLIYGRGPA